MNVAVDKINGYFFLLINWNAFDINGWCLAVFDLVLILNLIVRILLPIWLDFNPIIGLILTW